MSLTVVMTQYQCNHAPLETGNCGGAVVGADGLPLQIPCSLPPDRALFIQARLPSLESIFYLLDSSEMSLSYHRT